MEAAPSKPPATAGLDVLAAGAKELGYELDAGFGASFGSLALELGNVTAGAATGQTAGLVLKPNLDGFVPVALDGAELQYGAGSGFDYRHRHYVAAFVKNLRHPDLAAKQSNSHRIHSRVSVARE